LLLRTLEGLHAIEGLSLELLIFGLLEEFAHFHSRRGFDHMVCNGIAFQLLSDRSNRQFAHQANAVLNRVKLWLLGERIALLISRIQWTQLGLAMLPSSGN
jgi:hypothetical protein